MTLNSVPKSSFEAESVESMTLDSIPKSSFEAESVESMSLNTVPKSSFEAESVDSMNLESIPSTNFETESVDAAQRPSTPLSEETAVKIDLAAQKLKEMTKNWEKTEVAPPPPTTAKRARPMRKTLLSKKDEEDLNTFLDRRDGNIEVLQKIKLFCPMDYEKDDELIKRLAKLHSNTPENYEELQSIESKIWKHSEKSLKEDLKFAKSTNDPEDKQGIELVLNANLKFSIEFANCYLKTLQHCNSYTRISKIEKLTTRMLRQKMRLEKMLNNEAFDDTATVDSVPEGMFASARSVESDAPPHAVADADIASLDSSMASLNVDNLPNQSFEAESVSQVSVTLDDIPKDLFEEESAESVVNSVISATHENDRVVGRIRHRGTELPATQADLNLTALVNDSSYWETCSEESGFSIPDFDACDDDEDDDWD